MSRLPFELLLALRYLRPKRTFVSIITLISILGVALGVAVLIIVISVMSGFDRDLRAKILGFNAHLQIVASGQTMANDDAVMNLVAANKNVAGVAPYVLGPVLMETEPVGSEQPFFAVPYVRGADPARENSVSVLPQSIIAGKFDLSRRGLVIGSALAQSLNLAVGDRVSIYSPNELKKLKEHRVNQTRKPCCRMITPSPGFSTWVITITIIPWRSLRWRTPRSFTTSATMFTG